MANTQDIPKDSLLCFGVDLSLPAPTPRACGDAASPALSELRPADLDSAVELDRVRGIENVASIQKIVAGQQAVCSRILAKAHSGEEDGKSASDSPTASRGRDCKVAYPYAGVKLLSKKGMFNPSRMHNACDVGNKFAHAKIHQEKFQRRRKQCLHDELKKNDTLRRAHEEQDKRAGLCEHQLIGRQAEKMLDAKQKRLEHQKTLYEMQKNQDREFEMLRLKHHPTLDMEKPTKQCEIDKSEASDIDRSEARRGSNAGEASRQADQEASSDVTAEPIYRHALESHQLYDSTLRKWRGFVVENEQRTEAYWSKMLEGDARKKRERAPSKLAGISAFQKSAQDVKAICKFFATTKAKPDLDPNLGELAASDDEPDWRMEGFSSPGNSLFLRSSVSRVSSVAYEARLERVKSHHLDLEEQASQKLERDQQFLQEKREKGREEQNKKAGMAKDYNDGWTERSVMAACRRKEMSQKDDTGMMNKLADFKLKREESQAARDEGLGKLSASQDLKLQTCKAGAQHHLDQTLESFKAKTEKKNLSSSALRNDRLEAQCRAADSGIAEKVKAMSMQKEANEQAFKRSATEEILRKAGRGKVLKKPGHTMQAFERRGAIRKDASRTRKIPLELTLIPAGWQGGDSVSLEDLCAEDAVLGRARESVASAWAEQGSPASTAANGSRRPSRAVCADSCASSMVNEEEHSEVHGPEFLVEMQAWSTKEINKRD